MSLSQPTVLVVEDDSEIRDLECFLLSSEGYSVTGAADGEHAADEAKRVEADLVVLDMMLPKKDGAGVLEDLAADPATARIPVVIVSAFATRFVEKLTSSPQVRRFLQKPFDISELVDAVAQTIGPPSGAPRDERW